MTLCRLLEELIHEHVVEVRPQWPASTIRAFAPLAAHERRAADPIDIRRVHRVRAAEFRTLAPAVPGRLHDAERAAEVRRAFDRDFIGHPGWVRLDIIPPGYDPLALRIALEDFCAKRVHGSCVAWILSGQQHVARNGIIASVTP